MANPPCPCSSGLRLHLCCGPYLKATVEPPDAQALMRSRFSAFALGNVEHLWRTLHPEHPDRLSDKAQVLAELSQTARTLRFQRLTVLDWQQGSLDEAARVLFHARIFEAGRNVSFLEASVFRHDGQGWRYLSGEPRTPPPGWELLKL